MTRTEYIFTLFVAVLYCGGIFAAARPNGLLSDVRDKLQSKVDRGMLSHFIAYPLLLCSTCMASVHGTFAFIISALIIQTPVSWSLAGQWLLFVPACAMGNFLLWTVVDVLESLVAYLRSKQLPRHGNIGADTVKHH